MNITSQIQDYTQLEDLRGHYHGILESGKFIEKYVLNPDFLASAYNLYDSLKNSPNKPVEMEDITRLISKITVLDFNSTGFKNFTIQASVDRIIEIANGALPRFDRKILAQDAYTQNFPILGWQGWQGQIIRYQDYQKDLSNERITAEAVINELRDDLNAYNTWVELGNNFYAWPVYNHQMLDSYTDIQSLLKQMIDLTEIKNQETLEKGQLPYAPISKISERWKKEVEPNIEVTQKYLSILSDKIMVMESGFKDDDIEAVKTLQSSLKAYRDELLLKEENKPIEELTEEEWREHLAQIAIEYGYTYCDWEELTKLMSKLSTNRNEVLNILKEVLFE